MLSDRTQVAKNIFEGVFRRSIFKTEALFFARNAFYDALYKPFYGLRRMWGAYIPAISRSKK